jgi:FkbM family methyltransferase
VRSDAKKSSAPTGACVQARQQRRSAQVNEVSNQLKSWAKRWIRPVVIPIVRSVVRFVPSGPVKRWVWAHIVVHYLEYANYEYVANTCFGARIAGNTEDVIQRYVYYFGIWEPNLTRFINSRLRPGDIFIDVGANIGYFSLLASLLVGAAGKVLAFEASPQIFASLQANLRRNGVRNVAAHNVAVANHEGIIKVFLAAKYNLGKTTIFEHDSIGIEEQVRAQTLSALVAPDDVARVKVVKIDVEGAEWMVVSGMRELLRTANRELEIITEINPQRLQLQGKTTEDIFSIFSEFGFNPYRLENNYAALSYMTDVAVHPTRLRGPVVTMTDVVFSRCDAEWL